MKVLILSASTGGGHNRAAHALKDYILKENSENEVVVIDALDACSKILGTVINKGYKIMAMKTPELFGRSYRASDKESTTLSGSAMNLANKRMAEHLGEVVAKYSPDILVTTHPFVAQMTGLIKEAGKISIPVISVVTDFMPHRAYISDGIDAYVTASDDTTQKMIEKYKVSPEKVHTLGMPVYDRFYERDPKKIKETYKQLGFDEDKLVILIMAGSFGVTDILDIYENLNLIDEDFQMIIITGKNRRLYDAFKNELNHEKKSYDIYDVPFIYRMLGKDNIYKEYYDQSTEYKKGRKRRRRKITYKKKPTKLFYYVDNVDDYMHVSDLIITKPGGLTTSESLACGLPMAIFRAIPGQEEDNAEVLTSHNMAIKLKKGKFGAKQIEHMIRYPKRIMNMKENCKNYAQKDSCKRIYELMQQMYQKEKDNAENI